MYAVRPYINENLNNRVMYSTLYQNSFYGETK